MASRSLDVVCSEVDGIKENFRSKLGCGSQLI